MARTDSSGSTVNPLRLSAVTPHPRLALVAQLEVALRDLGWILDVQQFSNLALRVRFELAPGSVPKLRSALVALPMPLSDASLEALSGLENTPPSELPDAIPGSMQITFAHSEPDLRLPVPAVPG